MEEVTQDVAESSIYTIPTPGVLPDSDVAEDIKPERENDGSSIFCSVSKPEKVGEGMNAYVTYVVFTKNTDNTNASIARRYSDFSWLHEMLKNDFRNTLIPPLPEKAIFDRFSPEFVEYRRKELERFLKRVLSHPHLSKSPHVTKFLTASDAAMELERSKPKIVVTQQQQQQPKKEEKGFFCFAFCKFIFGHFRCHRTHRRVERDRPLLRDTTRVYFKPGPTFTGFSGTIKYKY